MTDRVGRRPSDLCPQDHHGTPRGVQNQAAARRASAVSRACPRVNTTLSGGHASVSISAAFGMAKAAELRGEEVRVVAVIGDGSMTGGLAFEGLNNAGASKRTNLLVILNDNNMAIDQATGALKNYLLKISTSVHYNRFKQRLWGLMSHTPRLLRSLPEGGQRREAGAAEQEQSVRKSQFPLFRSGGRSQPQGVGADASGVARHRGTQTAARDDGKGKGYLPAEHNQPAWHAPGRFNPDTGRADFVAGRRARYPGRVRRDPVELAAATAASWASRPPCRRAVR